MSHVVIVYPGSNKIGGFCELLCRFGVRYESLTCLPPAACKNVVNVEVLQTCLLSQRRQETFEGLLLCTPSGVMNKAGFLERPLQK